MSHFYDVVLPVECPPTLRTHPALSNPETAVTVRELEQLTKTLGSTGREAFHARRWARACLQPGYLDVPSVPKDDFLWSALWSGLRSVVVSARVRQTIETLGSPGLTFCPVLPGRIGRRSSKSPARIPKSSEPEDLLKEYPVGKEPTALSGYSQLLISAESLHPPGAEPMSVCPICGEEEQSDWNAKDRAWKELTADRIAAIAPDLTLFRIPERGTIFVADRLKVALEALGATNVAFKPFPPEPSTRPRRKSKLE